MNRHLIAILTITITAAAMVTVASCQKTGSTGSVTPQPGTGLRISAPFTSQTTDFAFDMFNRVNTAEGRDKNVFVSPLSLHIALGMILNGANGQTQQEIQRALKLDAQTLAEANQTYQNLMENLPGLDTRVTMGLANSVWYRSTFQVVPTFQEVLKITFKAKVSAENFGDPATVGKINAWASEQTKGRIPKVIDQIQPDNVLFLLNALYFKGDWQKPFDPKATQDSPFALASGQQTTVRMMRLNTVLRRAFRPTYTAVELPYGSDNYAMTALLPAPTTNADALIQSLTASEWSQAQTAMVAGKVDLGLPKFTLNYEINLNNVLAGMGMPTAFTDRADFTKINAGGEMLLSFVKQNTFVAVDEKGTEAAAVTTGAVSTVSIQEPTLFDRPFVVVIHEKTSGVVLFMGKIAHPKAGV
ncbi:MAG: serpin family protein [Bacteroidetes bacterium]|nr:serpin family protein [Fibrella sp.]